MAKTKECKMNDRFKFRVWDKGNEQYLNLSEVDYLTLDTENGGLIIGFLDELMTEMTYIPEKDMVVEQCTGLKDKNGNLIYEGDIVRFEIVDEDSGLGKTFERICEICFGKGDYSYSFVCKNDAYYRGYALLSSILCQEIESIEIIGNINEQAEQKDVK